MKIYSKTLYLMISVESEADSFASLNVRGWWNQMLRSKNSHEDVDLLALSSTPISSVYRSSSGKKRKYPLSIPNKDRRRVFMVLQHDAGG